MLEKRAFFPFDILNLILQYDGRIKYSYKDHIYVKYCQKKNNQ
jgi:hypothetical protein